MGMTELEAIETLQDIHDVAKCRIEHGDSRGAVYIPPEKLEAFGMSIKALETMLELKKRKLTFEHLENYMQFEDECVRKGFTFKSLLEAREKQTAKKVLNIIKSNLDNGGFYGDCPCCNEPLESLWTAKKFCPNCSQKLDWGNEDAE